MMLSKQEKTAQFLRELDTFLESVESRDVINRGFMPASYLGIYKGGGVLA